MQENILTSDQVAKILQIHPFTVLKFIKQGRLKASKIGRVYRIKESDVMQFLDQNTEKHSEKKSLKEELPPNQESQPVEPREVPEAKQASPQPKNLSAKLKKTKTKTKPPEISSPESFTTEPVQESEPPIDRSTPVEKPPENQSSEDHYYIL